MATLRERWASGDSTLGGWLAIPSTITAEGTARTGFDYVCVDNQHGGIDYGTTTAMLQAIALGGSQPIVRVPWNEPGIIGKMLDAGALGVVVPMVNSAAEAAAVVRSSRYPPLGERSFGPVYASMRHQSYAAAANGLVSVIPMIETVQAMNNLDEILATPGVDAIYVGPADLSLSLGLPPGNNDDRQEFTDALLTIAAACARHGVVAGIHATGALCARRLEQGFRMVTVAGDFLAMRTKLGEELAVARSGTAEPAPEPKAAGPKSIY